MVIQGTSRKLNVFPDKFMVIQGSSNFIKVIQGNAWLFKAIYAIKGNCWHFEAYQDTSRYSNVYVKVILDDAR